MAGPFEPSSAGELPDGLRGEPLELLEVVIAGRKHHVLDAGRLQIADAVDDLPRGPQEVRLLEVLERPVRAHHPLEDRPLQLQGFVAVRGVDQVGEVQVTVAQAVRLAPDLGQMIADRPDVVLDHLLAAGGPVSYTHLTLPTSDLV